MLSINTLPSWIPARYLDSPTLAQFHGALNHDLWGPLRNILDNVGAYNLASLFVNRYWWADIDFRPTSITFNNLSIQENKAPSDIDDHRLNPYYVYNESGIYLYNISQNSATLNAVTGSVDLSPIWDDIIEGSPITITGTLNEPFLYTYLDAYKRNGVLLCPDDGQVEVAYLSNNITNQISTGNLPITINNKVVSVVQSVPPSQWSHITRLYSGVDLDNLGFIKARKVSQQIPFCNSGALSIAACLGLATMVKWDGAASLGNYTHFSADGIPYIDVRAYPADKSTGYFQRRNSIVADVVSNGVRLDAEDYSVTSNILTVPDRYQTPYLNILSASYNFVNKGDALIYGKKYSPITTVYSNWPIVSLNREVKPIYRWNQTTKSNSSSKFI